MKKAVVFQKSTKVHTVFDNVTNVDYRNNMCHITWYMTEKDAVEPMKVVTSLPTDDLIRVDVIEV